MQIPKETNEIEISNLNLVGLFSTERGKRDLKNEMNDRDLRLEE